MSILDSIKKLLGIPVEVNDFDIDIIMHINSVFAILNQLGVGPAECFTISDNTTVWSSFTQSNTNIETVKTYVYLKVRSIFDPPTSSVQKESMTNLINELEFRLLVSTSDD